VKGIDAIVHTASPCRLDVVEIHGKRYLLFLRIFTIELSQR
jgi:hypothetical protein